MNLKCEKQSKAPSIQSRPLRGKETLNQLVHETKRLFSCSLRTQKLINGVLSKEVE